MNLTELARKLRINPNELREMLPQMGFHIGVKAIKVDNKTAERIMREWPKFREKLRRAQEEEEKKRVIEENVKSNKKIYLPQLTTVRDFSEISEIPISKILAELMKNGVFASMNEKIDFDTASIIGENLGIEVVLKEGSEMTPENEKKIDDILDKEDKKNLVDRAPVIVVMGHVDHGKTKLLDTIRKTNITEGEHGGITQHIGAYQVEKNNRQITFIDTPGHEAFAAMRGRGAKIADVAILVVAADDGVKPQTIEAFKIIQAAKIPFIVALNKIDKEGANIEKTKQELSSKLKIVPEDWGGKTVCAPISAIKGTGIDELLETILLVTDTEVKNLKANPNTNAVGTVIESHIDKASGPIATILIQNGTLKLGDQFCVSGKICGKARSLKNYKGETIDIAGPSTPVEILGLKIAPSVGDILEVGEGERVKGGFDKLGKRSSASSIGSNQNDKEEKNSDIKKLNIIIKSDVLGSAEAVEESLIKINTEDVKVNIINKGLGNIIEGDINRAESSNAQLIGFNVKVSPQVEAVLREKDMQAHTFNIIYDLIEYIKGEMQKLVVAKIEKKELGRLKVLEVFRTEDKKQIVGGKVLDGVIKSGAKADVTRDGELISSGTVSKIQEGTESVKEVEQDQECGIEFEGKPVIEKGDILNAFEEIETINKL